MTDYAGLMQDDLNPIRYNDALGYPTRYEVTECGNRHEDYIEICAFDQIPDRIFGVPLEGDRIVLPAEVAVKVAAMILRSRMNYSLEDEEIRSVFLEVLGGILGVADDDLDLDADDFDGDDDDDWVPPTLCADCGTDTCPVATGPRAEEYIVHDEVWAAAGMAPDGGHLCIGCLERRLGRQLTPSDFKPDVKLNDLSIADGRYAWSWRTPRLISRLSGQPTRTDVESTA